MKSILASVAFCLTTAVFGQNLVPNGSFEEYTECPDNAGVLDFTTDWVRIQGTPEYFNACGLIPWVSVPNNGLGYQAAYSGGDAYAGVIVYSDSDWFVPPELLREVIGVELTQPLLPGIPVYVSFRASPGAFGMPGAQVRWAVQGIGLKFVFGPLQALLQGVPASNDADVQLESILTDTAGWTMVSGTVVPDSAYDALLIGNFVSDSLLTPIMIDSLGTYGIGYAYVDDVVVTYQQEGVLQTTRGEDVIRAWYDMSRNYLCLSLDRPLSQLIDIQIVNISGITVATIQIEPGMTYVEKMCRLSGSLYWIAASSPGCSITGVPLLIQTSN